MQSIVVRKIISLLIKKGKRQVSFRLFFASCSYLKLFFKINPFFTIKKAVINLTPFFELLKIQKNSQTNYVPRFTSLSRRRSLGLRWILITAKASRSALIKQLALEFFNASLAKGKPFDKKVELLKKAEASKTAFLSYQRNAYSTTN
jgi:small subunit ribosomal protein S7